MLAYRWFSLFSEKYCKWLAHLCGALQQKRFDRYPLDLWYCSLHLVRCKSCESVYVSTISFGWLKYKHWFRRRLAVYDKLLSDKYFSLPLYYWDEQSWLGMGRLLPSRAVEWKLTAFIRFGRCQTVWWIGAQSLSTLKIELLGTLSYSVCKQGSCGSESIVPRLLFIPFICLWSRFCILC